MRTREWVAVHRKHHAYTDVEPNACADGDRYCHSHIYSDSDAVSNCNSYSNAYAFTHTHDYTKSNAYTEGITDAEASSVTAAAPIGFGYVRKKTIRPATHSSYTR